MSEEIPFLKIVRARFLEYPDKVKVQVLCLWLDDTYSFEYLTLKDMFERLPIDIEELKTKDFSEQENTQS